MVKLSTEIAGQKFEYNTLTVTQRAPIFDEYKFQLLKYRKLLGNDDDASLHAMTLELAIKIIKMATDRKDEDIDKLNESIVIALGSRIMNESILSKEQKKS